MVAPVAEKVLSGYLITLILKQSIDARFRRAIEQPSDSNADADADAVKIEINGDWKEGPKSRESEWMITVREKIYIAQKDNMAGMWNKHCIYRVPQYLRDNDDKAYFPNLISLGPYHHGKRRLRNMNGHKWRAFNQILKRCHQDAKLYIDSIKQVEQQARDCYQGQIMLSSDKFVEMLVLDGCFVLELFCGVKKGFTELGYSRCDPVFARRGLIHLIQRDMVILENQIPLFILDRLLGLQLGTRQNDQKGFLVELVLHFFNPLMPIDKSLPLGIDQNKKKLSVGFTSPFDPLSESYLHCLDVFRHGLLQGGPLMLKPRRPIQLKHWSHDSRGRTQIIHCVTELKEAGIKLQKRKTNKFWDIKFKNGILEIPRLLIHDGTKSLFLNLIAFEQSHLNCGDEITLYVIFMDNLINSEKDVAHLHHCGIIEHWLGSDSDVAHLFNSLCQEVAFNIKNSYLSELTKSVNQFYNNRWNSWRASLMHNYFNNPWAIISFMAAVILLILTSTQTGYGVYGYYRPS